MSNNENIPLGSASHQPSTSAAASLSKKEHFRARMKSQIVISKAVEMKDRLLRRPSQIQQVSEDSKTISSIADSFQKEYQELEKIGEGCHSVVKRCKHLLTGKMYAVKIIRSDDSEIIEQAEEEFRILKCINHPNVVDALRIFSNSSDNENKVKNDNIHCSSNYIGNHHYSINLQSQNQPPNISPNQIEEKLISNYQLASLDGDDDEGDNLKQNLKQVHNLCQSNGDNIVQENNKQEGICCSRDQQLNSKLNSINNQDTSDNLKNKSVLNALSSHHNQHVQHGFNRPSVIRIVQKLCEGQTMQKLIETGGSSELTIIQKQAIIVQLIQAVAHVHREGIAHRDIKPANIIINMTDNNQPHLTLLDFGVARTFMKFNNVNMLTPTGTTLYNAPELLRGQHYSHLVDSWALGITIFQFLTSHTPFNYANREKEMLTNMEEQSFLNHPLFLNLSSEAQDLITQFLEPDCRFRLSAQEALTHPFVSQDKQNVLGVIDLNSRQLSMVYTPPKQLADKKIAKNLISCDKKHSEQAGQYQEQENSNENARISIFQIESNTQSRN